MCAGCWLDEPDSHVTVNERVLLAAGAATALHEQHPTGGAMHIVTDDFNTDDDAVAFCGSAENPGLPMDAVELACFEAFAAAAEPERQSALAIMEGWHTASAGEVVTASHLMEWREHARSAD